MKIYAVVGEERSGCGSIIMTADKKKAERFAKIFNGIIQEHEEFEDILNNEKEILYTEYFRYQGIGERLDWVKDMVHAAEISNSKWNAERLGL